MLARRFLWVVTALILLVLAGALGYRLFAPALMRAAFVPSVDFDERHAPPGPDYRSAAMWIARPDLPRNPALWTPTGAEPAQEARASVFFVHPTSFLERSGWNAGIDDRRTEELATLFVRSQASAFNAVGAIWAPKYRQATVGAFLTDKPDAARAIALAHGDVLAAFDRFLADAPQNVPIILAGHSQGSLHILELLKERVAGKPLAARIAAVYAVGWPISIQRELPTLGLPACTTPDQSGCILAWQSFAEPAEPEKLLARNPGWLSAQAAIGGARLLCVNPLTGTEGGAAPAAANLGTLVPDEALVAARLVPGLVPARCDARGLLLIGRDPPRLPRYILPGNNYHVFDYALFWANIRADAERRLKPFLKR